MLRLIFFVLVVCALVAIIWGRKAARGLFLCFLSIGVLIIAFVMLALFRTGIPQSVSRTPPQLTNVAGQPIPDPMAEMPYSEVDKPIDFTAHGADPSTAFAPQGSNGVTHPVPAQAAAPAGIGAKFNQRSGPLK